MKWKPYLSSHGKKQNSRSMRINQVKLISKYMDHFLIFTYRLKFLKMMNKSKYCHLLISIFMELPQMDSMVLHLKRMESCLTSLSSLELQIILLAYNYNHKKLQLITSNLTIKIIISKQISSLNLFKHNQLKISLNLGFK